MDIYIEWVPEPSATAVFIQWRVQGDPAWIYYLQVYTAADTSATLTGFSRNTTYEFRIEQYCPTDPGVPQYSDPFVVYTLDCPIYGVSQGAVVDSLPTIDVVVHHIPGYSVTHYRITIYQDDGAGQPGVEIAQDLIPVANFGNITDLTYTYANQYADLAYGGIYHVVVQTVINYNMSSIFSDPCEEQHVITLTNPCSTYAIKTGDGWRVEWQGCDGNTYECADYLPWAGVSNTITICAMKILKTQICLNGVLTDTTATAFNNASNPATYQKGCYATLTGSGCNPSAYQNAIPPQLCPGCGP